MINSNLEDTTIVVSSYCIKENKDKLEKPAVHPGMDIVMIGSIGINYIMALFIERCSKRTGWKKILLVIDIACNLFVLFI